MTQFTVLLEDGTVGVVDSIHSDIVGDLLTVELHDENGNKIETIGTVVEVLSEVTY